jgi:acetoin utilization deacetylase AcuC-like enzyme
MATGIIYDDKYLLHKTGEHVESPARLIAINEMLQEEGFLSDDAYQVIAPRPATIEEIEMIHDRSMIEFAKKKSKEAGDGGLRLLDAGDTVVCGDSFDVALLAAGGCITAVDAVMNGTVENAFALIRPPGHHANRYHSSGFCIFNNVAIATEHLIRDAGVKRVAIFDIDLHHGNGTSEIFYGRNDVLYFSSHQDPRTQYPGTGYIGEIGKGDGAGYNLNVPLEPDAGDDVVQYLFTEVVKPIFEQFQPEILLGSVGFDAHHKDPLSGLAFTTQGYGKYVDGFKTIADDVCGGKLVCLLEGGYRVNSLAMCVSNILNVLQGRSMPHIELEIPASAKSMEYHERLASELKVLMSPYWTF